MSRKAVENMTKRIIQSNPRMTATQARQQAVKVVVRAEKGKGK